MPQPRTTDGLNRDQLRHDPEIPSHTSAPTWDWRNMANHEHFVQFYETDLFLVNSVSGFISAGLNAGDRCIVVATEDHRFGVEVRLQAYGLDISAAKDAGQYISLDAEETLKQFMVNGTPDAGRFRKVIEGIIRQSGTDSGRVRVFGEMVAQLWAHGNRSGAIRLEELWNDLHEAHPFTLFCAYPISGFGGETMAKPLGDVCATHSRVIPAESYTALEDTDERMRAILELQQKSKWLEDEILERKQMEERLRVSLAQEQIARAEAESANRMKDEFLATVSHELRTPLNAIIGWSQLLKSGRIDSATTTRAVDTIERNAKSQARLIEDILDVSRAITGKLRLNIAPVDMASVINAAIDSVQVAADSKNIQLAVIADPTARHTTGDSSRLQQVIWNLLSNAIKFTPSGGRVEVRLAHADSEIQITITDTGQGIRPELLPFVFDRFRQGDASSTRRHMGLGLGLSIVRHLVELHGGAVNAESEGEGCGSSFTIKLPLVPDSEPSRNRRINTRSLVPPLEADADVIPSLSGMRVLLVDDDQDNLQILTLTLTEYGADVRAAGSAAQAFQIMQSYEPDVLVSDLAMPNEDGLSLIKRVRTLEAASGKKIHAVAVTAYVRVEDRVGALSAGFNMFLPKPVEPSELIAAIANLSELA